MTVGQVAQILEEIAPRSIAWERDNVGLQVGRSAATVRGIMVALDVTPAIIGETRRKRANLLITHHPLLFRPVKSLTNGTATANCIGMLMAAGINLYAAHTNLDFCKEGTSNALAAALGLSKIDFLQKPYQVLKKIVTFVPVDYVDRVADAMATAGAGRIGNYDTCSFRVEGEGTFRGSAASTPFAGRKGRKEHVREIRLEMITDGWRTEDVLRAMKKAHPYEEVAYDVYPMENRTDEYGVGVIGSLSRPIPLVRFLGSVKRALGIPHLRYTGNLNQKIESVAVCGGSGSSLLEEAIAIGADAFVTSDIRYHAFQDANARIALIDAGHYETEVPVVRHLARTLEARLRKQQEHINVFVAKTSTNPTRYI
jgi:dinuclear metal center YbgI/SA1388 family protein